MLGWKVVVWSGEVVGTMEALGCCGCLVVDGERCIVPVELDSVVVALEVVLNVNCGDWAAR